MVTKGHSTTRRALRTIVHAIPSIRSLTRKNCPPGMIPRKGYTRKYSTAVRTQGFEVRKKNGKEYRIYPKNKNMMVESRCIREKGAPKVKPTGLFGPLKQGELAKYGYSFRRTEAERHAALKKAVEAYGATGVFRKLDAVMKLTKKTAPKASSAFRKDQAWIHKSFMNVKA